MAEVAGLVVGGVGIAALFDSCISAFEYIESASKYGKEYNKAALKISLLQLKLARWKTTVKIVEDANADTSGLPLAGPDDTQKLRDLLKQIKEGFADAEEKSKRYEMKKADPGVQQDSDYDGMLALVLSVKKLTLRRQKASHLGQKTRWALHDEKAFRRLIEDLDGYISKLVELFPAAEVSWNERADADAKALSTAPELEKIENAPAELACALEHVDPELQSAMDRLALQAKGHRFGKVELEDDAQAQLGTYVASGYSGPTRLGGGSSHGDVRVKNRSLLHVGDNLGGPYVLGAGFHRTGQGGSAFDQGDDEDEDEDEDEHRFAQGRPAQQK